MKEPLYLGEWDNEPPEWYPYDDDENNHELHVQPRPQVAQVRSPGGLQ